MCVTNSAVISKLVLTECRKISHYTVYNQKKKLQYLYRQINRTPGFWGYPRRLMITQTIESCWIPSQNKVERPWRYRSRSKVITCDTPSHTSDHLYQIWKESIQDCRRYSADTIFKVKAEWPWKYRSRSEVISCDTPFILVIICTKYGNFRILL